jgi:prephenate dehydrogenase
MEVLIVGAGEMGRWFGRTLLAHPAPLLETEQGGARIEIAFVDREPSVARDAATVLGSQARAIPLDAEESVDLVCFAVPISAVSSAIATHAGRARFALVDITGELTTPAEALADQAPDRERASMHPLFAAESAPGTVPIAVDNDGPIVDGLRAVLEAAGNSLVETTAAEHDEAMETIQGAAHAAVLAYALAAEPVPDAFATPISDALVDLVDRVTGNEPRVYSDIQSAFDGADRVAEAAARLAEADCETFETLYEEAGSAPVTTREQSSTVNGGEDR